MRGVGYAVVSGAALFFALALFNFVYTYFLMSGKNLKKYGEWAGAQPLSNRFLHVLVVVFSERAFDRFLRQRSCYWRHRRHRQGLRI